MNDGEISEAELDVIRTRAEAATKGPWESFVEGRDHQSGDDFIRTGGMDDRGPDLYVSHESRPAPSQDLDFIAHARQDIPRLLAEIQRLHSLSRR